MIIVQLPKLDIDYIKVLIAEEIEIQIDVLLGFDVEKRFEDFGFLKLSEGKFIVVFSIRHVKHSMDDTQRIPILEVRGVL